MRLSIIVPTYNNLRYLKFFVQSVKKNSNYNHQIVLHINDGSDGTLEFAKKKKIQFSHSFKNIGLCKSLNKAASLVNTNYILYSHDDMFFCKYWDIYLKNEVQKYKNGLFYLTGTNVSNKDGLINYNCGSTPRNFNEKKFNNFCKKDGTKTFLLKFGFNPIFFRKYYLRGHNNQAYDGPLKNPSFSFNILYDLVINKFKFFYHFLVNKK